MAIFHSIAVNFVSDVFLWPIAVTSVVGVAIVVERWKYLQSAVSVNKDIFLDRINRRILRGELKEAISLSSQSSTPITNIVKAGLIAVSNGKSSEEVQTAMDAVALKEIPKIEKRTGLLALIANIATLLGLLGTIAGLIGAFSAISGVSPAEKATLLSSSIARAMNATALGLFVAIPLLAVYGFLQTRSQELVDDVQEVGVTTLNFIISNRNKFDR